MKTSSQLIEGRNHRVQPGIGVHYPGTVWPLAAMVAVLQARPASNRCRFAGKGKRTSAMTSSSRLLRPDLQAKEKDLGDDLLFQTVASPVPSALTGLTAVFGMGTGVSPSLWSPKSFSFDRCEEVL